MGASSVSRMESVPFVDLGRGHRSLAADLHHALAETVDDGGFILGGQLDAFEREFAEYCGARHCVGVASGTSALSILFRASGVGPGDEVIVPGNTFIASALAVVFAGATPVFCDVDDATGLIDADDAAGLVGPRTAAVLAVHLFGQTCDMRAVRGMAARHGLAVFEDAAQAHGATFEGRRAGALGDGAAFSFYPSKNLGALGDGGAICTDDAAVAERARRLRNLGQARKGEHVEMAGNERLDGLQAAFLRVKLRHLDAGNARRAAIASRYRAGLGDWMRLLSLRSDGTSVHHLFPVRTERRDDLARELGRLGIATGVHYTPAVHRQPPLSNVAAASVELPVSDAWAREELSLPIFPELRDDEVTAVIDACRDVLGERSAVADASLIGGRSV